MDCQFESSCSRTLTRPAYFQSLKLKLKKIVLLLASGESLETIAQRSDIVSLRLDCLFDHQN